MPAQTNPQNADLFLTRREAMQGIVTLAASSLLSADAFSEAVAPINARPAPDTASVSGVLPFNNDWRFYRGDAPGAETPGFDDSSWRVLDVPHDWSIEDLPGASDPDRDAIWTEGTNPARSGPFDVYASEGQGSTGWVVGGIGWYRKTFKAPEIPASGSAGIRFEGIYMNAEVWLNGVSLGTHPYGYTGFAFDLTPHLKQGGNLLAVRVNNNGRNSRWYSGSGIFRKVSLSVAGPVHIPQHGISFATPEVSKSAASVKVETTIENSGAAVPASVRVRLVDQQGAVAAEAQTAAKLGPNARTAVTSTLKVTNPRLWSPSDPQLYRAEISIESNRKTLDSASITCGIRKVEVDAENGLRINGESIKLMGGCVHHDNGPLGSACIPRAEERRVEILKANGFNAIRTSHNPPSPAFLDACDRLGMVVIDEAFDCWLAGNKNPEDYHLYFNDWWQRDLESMILRDRNHPSVLFWSIGNEIHERAEPGGVEVGKQLAAFVHKLDPTRPVTAAICHAWDHPGQTWKDMQPAFSYLDVGGYNYQWSNYAPDHQAYPQRIMMGTESFPKEALQNWTAVETSPWVLGDFVWTAIDYLGESGIGNALLSGGNLKPTRSPFYPWFNSYCGDIDLIGNKKPQSFFRDVVWRRSKIEMAVQRPVPPGYSESVSMWGWSDELRSWTWPGFEGTPLRVRVYTRGDEVRLFVNGSQVGQKQLNPDDKLSAEFEVPYSPGELKAVAFEHGSEIGKLAFTSAGKPLRLVLKTDRSQLRASRDDLAYVMATVVDDAGRTVPDATIPVSFSVSGAGELAAVGNANPKDAASFRQPRRSTFHGECLAIVRPSGGPGAITLKAEAPGLEPAGVTITTVPA